MRGMSDNFLCKKYLHESFMIHSENAMGATLIPGKISSYQTEMIVINIDIVAESERP